MQPYLFPYLGYYQLVNSVDQFIFFDDVNFINKGWINRNNILQQNQASRFTVPLVKASQNKLINEIRIDNYGDWLKKFITQVELNYKKASHYKLIFDWLSSFLSEKQYSLISNLAAESVESISCLLDLKTKFLFSSRLAYKSVEKQDGTMKILAICKLLGADRYINASNGRDLYEPHYFTSNNISLNFIKMEDISYDQNATNGFVPNLSIIDVLMFNGVEKTKILLEKYQLT